MQTHESTHVIDHYFGVWMQWIIGFLPNSQKLTLRQVCSLTKDHVHVWCLHPNQRKHGSVRARKMFMQCLDRSASNLAVENAICLLMLNGRDTRNMSPLMSRLLLETSHNGGPEALPKRIRELINERTISILHRKFCMCTTAVKLEYDYYMSTKITWTAENCVRKWLHGPFVLYRSQFVSAELQTYFTGYFTVTHNAIRQPFSHRDAVHVFAFMNCRHMCDADAYISRWFPFQFPFHMLHACDGVSVEFIESSQRRQIARLMEKWGDFVYARHELNRDYNHRLEAIHFSILLSNIQLPE